MSRLKVVVTGAKGQLGQDFLSILPSDRYEVHGFGKEELDVTNLEQVKETISKIQQHIIIHTAAYTKVDQAEKEPDLAFQINGIGSRNLAIAASEHKSKLIYFSTDYVFNGRTNQPYNESDSPDPECVYATTKLAGERFVSAFHHKFFIIRTSWVYGEKGSNFVKSMIKASKERKTIEVVNDQIGCPTFTEDLVYAVMEIMETDKFGIYHISNSGSCSWYQFAEAIFTEAGIQADLRPCTTDKYPRLAGRPKYSVLNHTSLKQNGFQEMRHWRTALREFMKKHQKELEELGNCVP